VSGSNCFWSTSGTPASKSSKGLTVSAKDFARALDAKATIERNAEGAPNFAPFELAAGSALINAGVVPAQPLPFDAAYYQGLPDLGAIETR
jgi:hypothetical protein